MECGDHSESIRHSVDAGAALSVSHGLAAAGSAGNSSADASNGLSGAMLSLARAIFKSLKTG